MTLNKTESIFNLEHEKYQMGPAQIENLVQYDFFLTQYIFCRSRQDQLFDVTTSIFRYVEKFLEVEKIHEKLPPISSRKNDNQGPKFI